MSLITSPAMISPATDGTKGLLPGGIFFVPESVSEAKDCPSSAFCTFSAGSVEKTTLSEGMPRFFNS